MTPTTFLGTTPAQQEEIYQGYKFMGLSEREALRALHAVVRDRHAIVEAVLDAEL